MTKNKRLALSAYTVYADNFLSACSVYADNFLSAYTLYVDKKLSAYTFYADKANLIKILVKLILTHLNRTIMHQTNLILTPRHVRRSRAHPQAAPLLAHHLPGVSHQDRGHLRQGLTVPLPHLPRADHHPHRGGPGPPALLPRQPAAGPDGQAEEGGRAEVLHTP